MKIFTEQIFHPVSSGLVVWPARPLSPLQIIINVRELYKRQRSEQERGSGSSWPDCWTRYACLSFPSSVLVLKYILT